MKKRVEAVAFFAAFVVVVVLARIFWPAFALPSVTSLVVLGDLVARRFGVAMLHSLDRRLLFGSTAICGALLYATTLGVVRFDFYRAGFSAAAPLVIGVVAALIARRAPGTALTALVVLVAYDFNYLPSRNLFDYALDPLLVLGATVWCLIAVFRRVRRSELSIRGAIRTVATVVVVVGSSVAAEGSSALATNAYLGWGLSQPSRHGQAFFRVVTFERAGFEPRIAKRFPKIRGGMSLTYSDVRQPRSWFGHKYGDPDDRVRAEWAYFFVRREWRTTGAMRPYIDLGSGPMWSNRRIPAATSRFNFQSQFCFGLAIGDVIHRPVYLTYRFSHISNFEFAKRNPGWNVHALQIGVRVSRP